MPLTSVPMVARKSITTIQEGSVYKERYVMPVALPSGSTARQEFRDSSGASVGEITGTVDGSYVWFERPYTDVTAVPNGAGFYCYVHLPTDAVGAEHMVRYGTVFRRQLSFPDSPATALQNLPRRYDDDFQRPAGAVGGRWAVLVGQPRIFDNTEWFTGIDHPNSVGPQYDFFDRYYMRYYVPFASDSVTLSLSATKKGNGFTFVTLCTSSTASSFLYAGFDAGANKVELGYGTGPDIGTWLGTRTVLQPQITPVNLTVPGNSGMGTYKLRYDDVTKVLGLYNDDYTAEYASWADAGNIVPHGKGYRYFGIGGNSTIFDSGVQVAYIKAQDAI